MAPAHLFLLLLAIIVSTKGSTHHRRDGTSHEGDFEFDSNANLGIDLSHEHTEHNCPVKRLWGVPDMPAYVGRLFHLRIPKEAFSGTVQSYKVTDQEGNLPSWLWLDSQHGLLRGVPGPENRGEHRLQVTAIPDKHTMGQCRFPNDIFTIEVKDKKESPLLPSNGEQQCHLGEDETKLYIIIEKSYSSLTPKQKLNTIIKIAKFMALDYESFLIHSNELIDEKQHDIILIAGHLGGKKKHNKLDSSILELTVGCNGEFWPKHSILVHQLKQQVLDGTLTDIVSLPVTGWKVIRHKQAPLFRKQRQILPVEGSAYDDEEDIDDEDNYSAYGDEDDYEYTYEKVMPPTPLPPSSTLPPTLPPSSTPLPTHPHHHRHHHGETITTPKIKDPFTEKNLIEIQTLRPEIEIELEPLTPINFDINFIEDLEPSTQALPTIQTSTVEITTPEQLLPVSFVPSSPSTVPVEIPIQENEIIPTDTITTLDGTPQMETEDSSTNPPTPEASTESEYEFVPHATYASHTTSSTSTPLSATTSIPEDTTLYTTIDFTEQKSTLPKFPNSNTGVQSGNNSDEVTDDIFGHPGTAVIVPVTSSTTEQSKEQTAEETVPIIPEYTTTAVVRSPPPTPPFTEEEIESIVPTYKITEYESPYSPSAGRDTTPQEPTTTEKSSTIIGRTTETVDFTIPVNSPPQKQHRTKKVAVTAGKYFSYIIPEDLFMDAEDGTNLKLAMYDTEHTPIKASSWVQFDPKTREVYGLPLEEHVSKWEYLVEATDSGGASVVDTLDITVQQHKGRRTVNHEFSMKLRVQKKYPAVIDWQIRVLKGLVNLFRDTDMDQITVIEVDLQSDPMQFVWTNDTLPRNSCPKTDIDRLMGVLQSTPEGDPSPGLESAMSPELLIKSVAWKGTGACRAPPTPPPPQPPQHFDNFGPMPRNQIDHINATAGKLLIFKVPDDTFYDPEDGSARNLKMWLTKGDRSTLSPHNWLQFDTKNQEFFGLPMEKDIGRKEYQLVCEDSGGLTANDGLLVEVHSAPHFRPPVEFQMTLDSTSIESALAKRKFIEKLQNLFGDSDASHIKIRSISYRPTIVSWYNTSLPGDRCPEEEVKQLRNILVGSDGIVTERADVIMGADFPVMSVSLVNRGACSSVGVARIPETPAIVPSEDAAKPVNADNYLITFIVPIVVIVCMIIVASLIACILYKRRRTGKMDVGDDEEKQAFRPKIPVIFQDELDEKPDPSNKSPVIMKEEKPPLLPPPEYKGIDSSSPTPSHTPYHPPPPFTASRDTPRNNRPKPSPAYRKPPPYVPP